MNARNKVRISINGVHYYIASVESEDYVQSLAQELDEQVKTIMEKNSTVSFNDVIVLCAMNYVDAYRRSEENADRMRTQISDYLEDAAKARIELDEAKREIGMLRRQVEALEQGQTSLSSGSGKPGKEKS